jgi:16S rRNA (cytosine967-C5)-methyltransferase
MSELPRFVGPRHTARTTALQVLLDCRRRDSFVQEALDRRLSAGGLSPADRRLATQLAYGVLRRRITLQAIVEPFVTRPTEKVEPWLWDALRLGAFQLGMLDHIPVHAALNETVELAASFGRPGAKGFLNGVLRSVARLMTPGRQESPGTDALPLESGAYRRLALPVLPDPASHPVEYVGLGFGLPPWLVRRWAERYPLDELFRLGFWFAGPAPLSLRINPLRVTREDYLAACSAFGLHAEVGDHPQAINLRDNFPIRDLPGYDEGKFSVQDQSAMRVGSLLAPEPGMSVLDLCAAPGGKATHLAELMQDRGRIVACDSDSTRLQTVAALAKRLGLNSIETQQVSRTLDDAPAGPFDAVLADVPCSNTGVLGRRPEARDRLRPSDLPELAALQERLLHVAADRVRPGGVVVYSTCSIEPEENSGVVRRVLDARPELRLESEIEAVPGRPADGGYRARLRRSERG